MIKKLLLCLLAGVLFSCTYTKSGPAPEPHPDNRVYKVKLFEFQNLDKARIDTIPGEIYGYEKENRTTDTILFPLLLTRCSYSYFHMPDQQLPEGSNIDSLEVFTVDIFSGSLWEHNNLQPFAFGKKRTFFEKDVQSFLVHIPPGYKYIGNAHYIRVYVN